MNAVVLLLLACAADAPLPPPVDDEGPTIVVLEGAPLARRISLDLRGVTPTPDELDIAEDSGGVALLVEDWLEDPRFRQRAVDAFAEDWLLRVDALRVDEVEFGLDVDGYAFTRAFGDEPAQLMARVAAEDRPWTDIVTVDWTMANDLLGEVLPLEFADDSDAVWREARYTDGRPAGGVLMTSGLWLRFHTTLFNYNRARAAALARMLLCYDFLERPVTFSGVTGSTGEELQAATRTDEGCISCHSGLDPLASALFGFWPYEDKDGVELVTYHPERERYGEELMGLAPAYFGTPIDAVSQLGPLVAADPRFERCTVQRTADRLWGRSTDSADLEALDALAQAFEDGGLRYRALVRAVLATEEYRAGDLTAAASYQQVEQVQTARQLSPLMLASAVEDLTGFRWSFEGWDLLDSDEGGYRLLAGGADGLAVRTPNHAPTVTRSLVVARLAEAAADLGVRRDFARPREERSLIGLTVDDPASLDQSEDARRAELRAVHRRVLGRAPTTEEEAELVAFWDAAAATSGGQIAWTGVVGLLLQDPGFWSY